MAVALLGIASQSRTMSHFHIYVDKAPSSQTQFQQTPQAPAVRTGPGISLDSYIKMYCASEFEKKIYSNLI